MPPKCQVCGQARFPLPREARCRTCLALLEPCRSTATYTPGSKPFQSDAGPSSRAMVSTVPSMPLTGWGVADGDVQACALVHGAWGRCLLL